MSAQFDFSKAAQKPPPTSKGVGGPGAGSLGGNQAPVGLGNNNFGGGQPNQVPGTRGGRLGTMQRQNEHRPITSFVVVNPP